MFKLCISNPPSKLVLAPGSKPVGLLSTREKALVIKDLEANLKVYRKVALPIAWLMIVIIVGVLVVPAVYVLIDKTKKRIKLIKEQHIEIYEVTGKLSVKPDPLKAIKYNAVPIGPSYCYIDGHLIASEPLAGAFSDKPGLMHMSGKTVTIQYVPSISRLRSYIDSEGRGYNIIANEVI